MKITLALLLLELCSAYVPDGGFQPDPSCLNKALQSVPVLFQSLSDLICKYRHAKDTNNEKLFHEVYDDLIAFLDELRLTETLLKGVCTLLGDLLASDCVEEILKNTLPNIVDRLNNIACKAESPHMLYLEIYDTLGNVSCSLDELLGTRDQLENLSLEVAKVVDKATRKLLTNILVGIVDDLVNAGDDDGFLGIIG